MIRTIRSLAICLVPCLALFVPAPQVAAGGLATVPAPFDDVEVCGSLDVSSTLIMTTAYVASVRCDSHCRKAGSECRNIVRRVGSCYRRVYDANGRFLFKNCEETTDNRADEQMCKEPLKVLLDGIRDALKTSVDSSVGDCTNWENQCRLACLGPV